MLVRDWIQNEIKTALTGLTVNSVSITPITRAGQRKSNYLHIYIGDETNTFALNDVNVETGTLIAYELILEMSANGNYESIQNEAIEKIKKLILKYRRTLAKRVTNADFTTEIIDVVYNNIYAPEDVNDRVVLAMIQGEIIINQIFREV